MWPRMRTTTMVSLLWGASLVHSAINIDGTQAVEPVNEHDPSPISDPNTYHPDQHDCPLVCVDYSNTHSWIPYLSVDRLGRCKGPMLLQFSVTQPLDDPASTIFIRSCTLGSHSASVMAAAPPMQNPKKASNLYQGGSLSFAPACTTIGTEVHDKLSLATRGGGGNGDGGEVAVLLEGMRTFFGAKDNCNENFLFAYHKQTVASVYIGAGLGKPTAESALKALSARLRAGGSVSNHTVAQLCGRGRRPGRVFGISVDTTGDLAAVQKTALEWSKGNCAAKGDLRYSGDLLGVKVFDIGGSNSTLSSNGTSLTARFLGTWRKRDMSSLLDKRAICQHIEIVSGDSCAALASRCRISATDFTKYNPKKDFCATLQPGKYACCSSGDPYTPPKPDGPKPNPDGTCATHLIQNGDSCDSLAKKHGVTAADLEKWNKGKTWAWTDCKDMLVGYNMCLSSGSAPMPSPQQGAECGPLVPGTKPPADKSTPLADLNPCPPQGVL